MAEVDKFKRRVIRAVARLIRKEQAPGEEMWKALQNEAGCDCKILWQRMRALTLKKMKRLILAEDRLENIAEVAKMSLTDWLLFDLVLVHEDIDVIGQDLETEPSMLTDLFNAVKRFQIEGKQGEALATAWTAATFYYNSFGRQCSPMMLQRRWYQLKKVTRTNFYKFWFEYRGNARLLDTAKNFQPSKLQSDIAQRFPHLVTMPFLEWDTMIKEKWIILPEEFEAKIKKKNTNPKPATNEPDVVLVEQQIETIDLGVESDHELEPAEENSKDSTYNALNPVALAAAIKNEPKDEFEMDFEDEFEAQVVDKTYIPIEDKTVANSIDETIAAVESLNNDLEVNDLEVSDEHQDINAMPKICSVAGNFSEDVITPESTNYSVESRREEVMDEINNILKSAAEAGKETRCDSTDLSSDIISPNSPKLHQRPKQDVKVMQIELDSQPMDVVETDDSIAVSSRDEIITNIDNFLKSAADINKQTHIESNKSVAAKIGPKSKILKHTSLDANPLQVESAAQVIDVDLSDTESVADGSNRNEIMTEINNILKSAAEVKTRKDNIKSTPIKIGPKSVMLKRNNLEATRKDLELAAYSTDIDECDKDSIPDGSNRIEVMTEINNILESAIQGKTQTQKPFNKTLVRDKTSTDEDKSVEERIEEITDHSNIAMEIDSTKVIKVEQDFEEIIDDDDDKDEIVTDIKVEETPLEDVINNITRVTKTSSAENPMNDPSIDIHPDFTFEDDGIELVDDGIAFEEDDDYAAEKKVHVKSESGASTSAESENFEEPAKFDLKLLMHPCVYTIKLEDMTVFKNKSIDEVKDGITLETAFRESKIHVDIEQITEIKEEQDKGSVKSGYSSDKDFSDCEDSITEKNKVKLSSYMLQKPKSRSYNPIQVCKNPDFNTRLKRLTAGFLSSSRNRLLLKCLKPMTIDLSKAFESKLINGTVYLKMDDGPKIKCEKPEVRCEDSSVTAVLPSAMPAQSLIDNSSINLQDLLPSPLKLTTKSYDLVSERQKTINLPDINNIRRINQHLLTAEVTPMRIQSNNKFIPPVQIIPAPKVNSLNTLEGDPKTSELRVVGSGTNAVVNSQVPSSEMVYNSIEVNNTQAVSDLLTTSVEKKKKKERPKVKYTWNAVQKIQGKPRNDEFLLSLDALNKMLLVFNGEDCTAKAKTERVKKKTLVKQKLELQKRMDQFEKKIEDVLSESEVEVATDEKVVKPADEKVDSEKEKKKEEPLQEVVTPKINIVADKPYGAFCCWARMKLAADRKRAIRSHKCPRICRCCCRDELAEKFHQPRSVKPVVNKPNIIVLSDDEETKKMCDSIDTVVNQSRNSLAAGDKTDVTTVLANDGLSRTEVSIQCDMSPGSDFGKMDLASVPTQSSINPKKPHQSKVIKINDADPSPQEKIKALGTPVSVRKDLIVYPGYRSLTMPVKSLNAGSSHKNRNPIACEPSGVQHVKHHGHITIDGSQRNLQINSESVFINTDGQEKILYLNNKQNNKSITSPVFLGENKILLTDIKFPSTDPAQLRVQSSKPSEQRAALPAEPPVPPQALPSGVQVMLLPDGQLTYSIDPGTTLTDEETATIPVILEAIRQQLNQTPALNNVSSSSIEVINLTDEKEAQVDASSDTNASADDTSNIESFANVEVGSGTEATIEQDKQKSINVLSNIENATDTTETSDENQSGDIINEDNVINAKSENIPLSTDASGGASSSGAEGNQTEKENTSSLKVSDEIPLLQNTTLSTGDKTKNDLDTASQVPVEKSAEPINIPEKNNENTNESTNYTAKSNRKTLLSDLMEMSGISEEDIQTNVPAFIDNTNVQPDIAPVTPVIESSVVPQVQESQVLHVPRVTAGPVMPGIPELTPITSFSQLKYACEHNGRFFKLDLLLGTLSKIAVCIKKNKPRIPPPYHRFQKSVIDLTDDQDVPPVKATIIAKKIKTYDNKKVLLDEASLPAHRIQTNKNHVSLHEEILPATLIQTNKSLLKSNNTGSDTVKPLKLFRAIRILKRSEKDTRIPLKVTNLGRGLPEEVTVRVQPKRKQDLHQSQVKDKLSQLETEEMVDDCSLDSDELDQYIWKESEPVSDSESDTSDDEPLAHKAKRIKGNEPQPENTLSKISEEPAVARQEKVTISEKGISHDECELDAGEKISGQDRHGTDTAKEAGITTNVDIPKAADVTEMAIPEEANMMEDTEFSGVEEEPTDGDLNLLPALQVVEPMDEEEDEDNCILGF